MKMGQIIWRGDGEHGSFVMQTPAGERDVTLRCRHDGVVCIEEVAGGGITLTQVNITSIEAARGLPAATAMRQRA